MMALLAAASLLCTCGSEDVPMYEQWLQQQDEARVCEPGDTCVMPMPPSCVCGLPVNELAVDDLNAFAREVDDCESTTFCGAYDNLRCEDNVCVGDRL